MRRTVRNAARERDGAMVAGSYAMRSSSSDRLERTGTAPAQRRDKFARICAAWDYCGPQPSPRLAAP